MAASPNVIELRRAIAHMIHMANAYETAKDPAGDPDAVAVLSEFVALMRGDWRRRNEVYNRVLFVQLRNAVARIYRWYFDHPEVDTLELERRIRGVFARRMIKLSATQVEDVLSVEREDIETLSPADCAARTVAAALGYNFKSIYNWKKSAAAKHLVFVLPKQKGAPVKRQNRGNRPFKRRFEQAELLAYAAEAVRTNGFPPKLLLKKPKQPNLERVR